jgi:hypothetical protein
VVRFGVGVVHDHCNRGTGCAPLENARENLNFIGLTTLRTDPTLTDTSAIKFTLNIGNIKRQTGGATIDGTTNCRPVRLAPRC